MLDLILFFLLMILVIVMFIMVEYGDIANKLKRDDDFAGGRGTVNRPYLVKTQDQLHKIRYYRDKHFKQIADIDVENYCKLRDFSGGWQPVGREEGGFRGTFDGNNYIICGLRMEFPAEDNIGLFAVAESGAIVRNLILENVEVQGRHNVGAVAGKNFGEIINCKVSGEIAGHDAVGGIAGKNSGEVSNCSSETEVTAQKGCSGGIVGKESERLNS